MDLRAFIDRSNSAINRTDYDTGKMRMCSPEILLEAGDLVNLDESTQPVTGFKKVEFPKLRDRDRKL